MLPKKKAKSDPTRQLFSGHDLKNPPSPSPFSLSESASAPQHGALVAFAGVTYSYTMVRMKASTASLMDEFSSSAPAKDAAK